MSGSLMLQDLQHRYTMALELLGERNERVEQLEEDINEMKQIFHTQLDLMSQQLNVQTSAQAQTD